MTLEFVCEVCDQLVYSARGTSVTRCMNCESDEDDAEQRALRDLIQDSHEKGRTVPPSLED